jgi:mannosyltransferase OCH1-like enzyme
MTRHEPLARVYFGTYLGYQARQMLPRIIHQMWVNPSTYGSDEFPEDVRRRTEHWQVHHPEYIHRIWSLTDVIRLGEGDLGARCETALRSLRFPASIADLSRLIILYEFGGFWSDLKLDVRAPFLDSLRHHDLVLTEHFPKPDFPEPNGFLCSAFIGVTPRSPFIRRVVEITLKKVEARKQGSTFYVTGPINLGEAMNELGRESLGDYKLLPHATTWEKLFYNINASYNENGMHWSIRETGEALYK